MDNLFNKDRKYRPFSSLLEFMQKTNIFIGDTVITRAKKEENRLGYKYYELFTGYYLNDDNHTYDYIFLNGKGMSFEFLFKHLELFIDGKWQPFGILEK